jgi:hypothetical protein
MHYWFTERYAIHLFALKCGRAGLLGLRKYETEYYQKVFCLRKLAIASGSVLISEDGGVETGYSYRDITWLQEGIDLLTYNLFAANQAIWEAKTADLLARCEDIAEDLRFNPSEISAIIPGLVEEAQDWLEIALAEREKLRGAYQRWRKKRTRADLPLVELILSEPDDVIRTQFKHALGVRIPRNELLIATVLSDDLNGGRK